MAKTILSAITALFNICSRTKDDISYTPRNKYLITIYGYSPKLSDHLNLSYKIAKLTGRNSCEAG